MSSPEPCCSFCRRPKSQVRVLVAGKHAHICDSCVAICDSNAAPLAHCSGCKPVAGRHAPDCDELETA